MSKIFQFSVGVAFAMSTAFSVAAEPNANSISIARYGVDSVTANKVITGKDAIARLEMPITNDSLLELGAIRAKDFSSFLAILEHRYGVDREVLLGIWGIESRFGQNVGNEAIGPSLLHLSRSQPGKREFVQQQLKSAMRLVDQGVVDHRDLVGSWAGALGQTQFLPTSYERFGVDGNGDGKIDLWIAKDALASTANYLYAHGWKKGEIWGRAVEVPEHFYDDEKNRSRQSLEHWKAAGVKPKYAEEWPDLEYARIERYRGEDFLLSDNFFVIMTYNASRDYAFSVSALGDQILHADKAGVKEIGDMVNAGANIRLQDIRAKDAPGGTASKPKGPCRSKVCGLQIKLKRAGFYHGAVDGVYGPQTKRALGQYLLSRQGRN